MFYGPLFCRFSLQRSARMALALTLITTQSLSLLTERSLEAGGFGVGSRSKSVPKPISPQRMLTIAGQFEKQGDYTRAANLYEKVLQQHPGHLEAQKRWEVCQAELARSENDQAGQHGVAPIPTMSPGASSPQVIAPQIASPQVEIPAVSPPEQVPPLLKMPVVAVKPAELPPPPLHLEELKPHEAGTVQIGDDDWNSTPTSVVKTQQLPFEEIPHLKPLDELEDEPEMLSVTTHPQSLEEVPLPVLSHSLPQSASIEPTLASEGPKLSLRKLETRISVPPNGLSASAGSVTKIIEGRIYEEIPSPQLTPKQGIVSLDDAPDSPHIGRVGLSSENDLPFSETVIPPESISAETAAPDPLSREFIPLKHSPKPIQTPERSESHSPSANDSSSPYSGELLDETVEASPSIEEFTPDYRTGLLAVCPRATQEIRRLIRSMETPNVRIRKTSLLRLCEMRGNARAAAPAVRELLFDPEESIRVLAAYSLWQIDQDASGMLTLTDVVVTGKPENSCLAAYALGEIGPKASESLSLLEHIARNGDGLMKLHAWEATWKIRKGDEQALKGMLSLLKHGNAQERWLATYMLGASGCRRLNVIHELCSALDDHATEVRTGAGFALGCIGPDAVMATPRLISIFETSEFEDALRMTAYEALTEIEPLTAAKFQFPAQRNEGRIVPVGGIKTSK